MEQILNAAKCPWTSQTRRGGGREDKRNLDAKCGDTKECGYTTIKSVKKKSEQGNDSKTLGGVFRKLCVREGGDEI